MASSSLPPTRVTSSSSSSGNLSLPIFPDAGRDNLLDFLRTKAYSRSGSSSPPILAKTNSSTSTLGLSKANSSGSSKVEMIPSMSGSLLHHNYEPAQPPNVSHSFLTPSSQARSDSHSKSSQARSSSESRPESQKLAHSFSSTVNHHSYEQDNLHETYKAPAPAPVRDHRHGALDSSDHIHAVGRPPTAPSQNTWENPVLSAVKMGRGLTRNFHNQPPMPQNVFVEDSFQGCQEHQHVHEPSTRRGGNDTLNNDRAYFDKMTYEDNSTIPTMDTIDSSLTASDDRFQPHDCNVQVPSNIHLHKRSCGLLAPHLQGCHQVPPPAPSQINTEPQQYSRNESARPKNYKSSDPTHPSPNFTIADQLLRQRSNHSNEGRKSPTLYVETNHSQLMHEHAHHNHDRIKDQQQFHQQRQRLSASKYQHVESMPSPSQQQISERGSGEVYSIGLLSRATKSQSRLENGSSWSSGVEYSLNLPNNCTSTTLPSGMSSDTGFSSWNRKSPANEVRVAHRGGNGDMNHLEQQNVALRDDKPPPYYEVNDQGITQVRQMGKRSEPHGYQQRLPRNEYDTQAPNSYVPTPSSVKSVYYRSESSSMDKDRYNDMGRFHVEQTRDLERASSSDAYHSQGEHTQVLKKNFSAPTTFHNDSVVNRRGTFSMSGDSNNCFRSDPDTSTFTLKGEPVGDRYLQDRYQNCQQKTSCKGRDFPELGQSKSSWTSSSVDGVTSSRSGMDTPIHCNRNHLDSNSRGSSENNRLSVLKEITRIIEMRQKAKMMNEHDEIAYLSRHLNLLNNELRKIDSKDERADTGGAILGETRSASKSHLLVENKTTKKVKTIKLRAPGALKAGEEFIASINGEVIKAIVPHAVMKGEVFHVDFPPREIKENNSYTGKINGPKSILKRKIKVRAPSDLPEGRIFTTNVKGKIVKATVPKGGVEKGDVFSVPYLPNDKH